MRNSSATSWARDLADELEFDTLWRAATDIAALIAPVTAPLAQYLPSFTLRRVTRPAPAETA